MTTIPNRMAPRTHAVEGDGGSGVALRGRAATAGRALPGPVRPGPALPALAGPVRDPDREPVALAGDPPVVFPMGFPVALPDAGRGVPVRAYSYVSGEVPDFAIVAGQPARVIGDTREIDADWLTQHPAFRADYEAWSASTQADG